MKSHGQGPDRRIGEGNQRRSQADKVVHFPVQVATSRDMAPNGGGVASARFQARVKAHVRRGAACRPVRAQSELDRL